MPRRGEAVVIGAAAAQPREASELTSGFATTMLMIGKRALPQPGSENAGRIRRGPSFPILADLA
jgi:hypothetical protein